jgi:hypothetical protein
MFRQFPSNLLTARPVAPDNDIRTQRRARWVTARKRRMLARWLRRTAKQRSEPHPLVRRRELLLDDRVAAVRTDLLELAVMLEHAQDPDPACLEALQELLSDGCGSPLYNSDVHDSELRATLYYARSWLQKTTITPDGSGQASQTLARIRDSAGATATTPPTPSLERRAKKWTGGSSGLPHTPGQHG